MSRNELIAAIRQKQAKNPEQAVVIAADKDVRYEAVLDVMDMLQQNQVRKGRPARQAAQPVNPRAASIAPCAS